MDLEIDLRRDAAFERLVRLINDPIFVSRHMQADCETLVYVPHVRYLTKTQEILEGVVGFEDVYFSVATVTPEAMRGKAISFVLMPPEDTLARYQIKNFHKIVEWFKISQTARSPHAFTIY